MFELSEVVKFSFAFRNIYVHGLNPLSNEQKSTSSLYVHHEPPLCYGHIILMMTQQHHIAFGSHKNVECKT